VTLPSIQLRPGVNVDEAIRLLEEQAENLHGKAFPPGVSGATNKQTNYVNAVTAAETRLRSILSMHDAAALFDGPRHRDICSMTPGEQLHQMISAEVDAQAVRIGTLAIELKNTRNLFAENATCLVLDSSFYIEHPEKLEDVDFHKLAGSTRAVKVLIPMVVVDELDGLKRNRDRDRRWRAASSLAVIDRVIEEPPAPGILHAGQSVLPEVRGPVWLQIVIDPPDHVRLPIPDDEIVDRCVACQPYSGPITVVTYDTGQSQRARAARLDVRKLRNEPEQPSEES
jgi:hypothetical protein